MTVYNFFTFICTLIFPFQENYGDTGGDNSSDANCHHSYYTRYIIRSILSLGQRMPINLGSFYEPVGEKLGMNKYRQDH